MTPMKAIRAKCLDCCCGQYKEVKLCPCSDCPLYPFRLGRNPNRAGIVNNGSFSQKLTAQHGEESGKDTVEGSYTPQPQDGRKEAHT